MTIDYEGEHGPLPTIRPYSRGSDPPNNNYHVFNGREIGHREATRAGCDDMAMAGGYVGRREGDKEGYFKAAPRHDSNRGKAKSTRLTMRQHIAAALLVATISILTPLGAKFYVDSKVPEYSGLADHLRMRALSPLPLGDLSDPIGVPMGQDFTVPEENVDLYVENKLLKEEVAKLFQQVQALQTELKTGPDL